ncbi:hypothetical protein I350_03817 [Cryptococcus amylolentus CBS 6273]|uniref:DUF1264 domain-containing protein n=1 Tax=Cryptococcus amylolentus CBS 6273 TaxID=1296118 RepID=A0A1E3K4V0_9TREE|nr:hypothetical protein I350_03817 [Cryptococcus amylolentus CBS 6273]
MSCQHSAGDGLNPAKAAYETATTSSMSFTPINQIHQHLCGLHIYADDPLRPVRAHHYCTHLRKDLHQCVIYDGDGPGARLIGVEYLIPEEAFQALPSEERKYWHSHKYEVDSGMLVLGTKSLVPDAVTDIAEQPAMMELHTTYGKTTHTWQYDIHPDLPLGPPALMMAYTDDAQLALGGGKGQEALDARDRDLGVSTLAKRQVRQNYLAEEDLEREPVEGCDVVWKGKLGNWKFVEKE